MAIIVTQQCYVDNSRVMINDSALYVNEGCKQNVRTRYTLHPIVYAAGVCCLQIKPYFLHAI